MKKVIAIILAVICLASSFSVTGYAAAEDIIGGVIGGIIGDDLLGSEEESEDAVLEYGIHYEMETLTMVTLMYKPTPTITFKAPTTAKVTTDTPLSVDYEFVCWKHAETGEYYYPGDEIEVTGKVVLYAVFEEKTDNYPQLLRYVITGLECFKRLLKKFLAVTDGLEENDNEYYEPDVAPAA